MSINYNEQTLEADPEKPDKCPDCEQDYIYRRRVAIGNWFNEAEGFWYVHEAEQEGNGLIEIQDQCYVKNE